MGNKVTYDDLMAEVEESYKAVEFVTPDGETVNLRAITVLPRHQRTAVMEAVDAVNAKNVNIDQQEDAVDAVLVSVADADSDHFGKVLQGMPLVAKARLIEMWSEATQAPEA
ncbi:phage tail assembly protein [Streptomyces chrestomyceticus]|uniref:phage tail assembly protein n=1 Tax=Streptomyces chrestomyceticus TaxID=68185 RepID=UPI0037B43C8C